MLHEMWLAGCGRIVTDAANRVPGTRLGLRGISIFNQSAGSNCRAYCLRAAGGAGTTIGPGTQLMLPMVLGPYCTKPVAVVGECGAEIGR